jgi:hypothetical protein
MSSEQPDWVDDDSMSAQETMRRFEALEPVPTTGPPDSTVDDQVPTPEQLVPRSAGTYSVAVTTKVVRSIGTPELLTA